MSAALVFATNCQRYGVGSAQCPEASLRYWAEYTRKRSGQAAYDQYYAPLIAQLDPAPATGAQQTLTVVNGQLVTTPLPQGPAPEAGQKFIDQATIQALVQLLLSLGLSRTARARALRI